MFTPLAAPIVAPNTLFREWVLAGVLVPVLIGLTSLIVWIYRFRKDQVLDNMLRIESGLAGLFQTNFNEVLRIAEETVAKGRARIKALQEGRIELKRNDV